MRTLCAFDSQSKWRIFEVRPCKNFNPTLFNLTKQRNWNLNRFVRVVTPCIDVHVLPIWQRGVAEVKCPVSKKKTLYQFSVNNNRVFACKTFYIWAISERTVTTNDCKRKGINEIGVIAIASRSKTGKSKVYANIARKARIHSKIAALYHDFLKRNLIIIRGRYIWKYLSALPTINLYNANFLKNNNIHIENQWSLEVHGLYRVIHK